jgi:hypothetical protein
MFVTGMGNLWGAGMSRAYATETAAKGWIIPTSMQLIPAALMLALVPFSPESPRWLILKGQMEKAKTNMDRLRPQHDVDSGVTRAEVDALESSIEDAHAQSQGTWLDLFRGNYLRRTWVRLLLRYPILLLDSLHVVAIANDLHRFARPCSYLSKPTATSSSNHTQRPFTSSVALAPTASPTVSSASWSVSSGAESVWSFSTSPVVDRS